MYLHSWNWSSTPKKIKIIIIIHPKSRKETTWFVDYGTISFLQIVHKKLENNQGISIKKKKVPVPSTTCIKHQYKSVHI